MSWSNWSGSVTAAATVQGPQSLDQLANIVRTASNIRAVGAGHSFMPLCASDIAIVSVEDLPGDIIVSADRTSARVPAGRSIKHLTAELFSMGLALANQGDVNPQSIAGSMATGTHGTGRDLGSLSTLARGFALMGADGEVRWCDGQSRPDLFAAQRLSLGMFGIATEVELDVLPAFYLAETIVKMPLAQIREQFASLEALHRHVEFFIFPHADLAIVKTLSLTDPCDPPASTSDMEEAGFRRILDLGAAAPVTIPMLQKQMMRGRYDSRRSGPAYTIFPSDRTIAFEEMEYEVPRAAGFDALYEAIDWIRRKRLPIAFPFEFRVVAADDIWMSPMHAGPVASISMHQYARMKWTAAFADIEAIFKGHGGRPHWAKRHTLTRECVDALYPMAERYRDVRRAADPEGKFLNPYLAELFS